MLQLPNRSIIYTVLNLQMDFENLLVKCNKTRKQGTTPRFSHIPNYPLERICLTQKTLSSGLQTKSRIEQNDFFVNTIFPNFNKLKFILRAVCVTVPGICLPPPNPLNPQNLKVLFNYRPVQESLNRFKISKVS